MLKLISRRLDAVEYMPMTGHAESGRGIQGGLVGWHAACCADKRAATAKPTESRIAAGGCDEFVRDQDRCRVHAVLQIASPFSLCGVWLDLRL